MPASASARLLTQAEWPSAASNSAGRSGTARSSKILLGFPPGKAVSSQPTPRTHAAFGLAAAHAAMESAIAAAVGRVKRVHSPSSTPPSNR